MGKKKKPSRKLEQMTMNVELKIGQGLGPEILTRNLNQTHTGNGSLQTQPKPICTNSSNDCAYTNCGNCADDEIMGTDGSDCGDYTINADNEDKVLDKMPDQQLGVKQAQASTSSVSVTLGEEDSFSKQSPRALDQTTATLSQQTDLNKPWSSLCKNNRVPNEGFKLEFIEPSNGLWIREEELSSISDVWGPTLIGYVAGRFPRRKAIMDSSPIYRIIL